MKGVEVMDKGLCVKGLDIIEIGRVMETYVAEYVAGYRLGLGQSMFAESHMLYFNEVKAIIPGKYHNLFTDESKFIGASGYAMDNHVQGKADEYVVMLLMDEHSERAFLLCLQETDNSISIIKDFLA